jgi:hypothetical protein
MLRKAVAAAFVLTVLSLAAREAVAAQAARFASRPRAVRINGKSKIAFAVGAPTDVEVSVLDAGGKVVRHLAAGYLGGNPSTGSGPGTPPPPPLKPGLRQEIIWDGKDDSGDKVSGAKVRVRLGLKPEFSHFIGGNPQRHLGVVGLGCGPKGELYVQSSTWAPSSHYVHMEVKAYDRDGKHLRQIVPYSAELPAAKRKAMKWLEMSDGPDVPMIYHGSAKCLYPGMGGGGPNILVRPDGKLALFSGSFRDKPGVAPRALVLGPDGSAGDDYLGPRLGKQGCGGMYMTALSPDGKTLYVSGFRNRRTGAPVPVVLKTTWENKGAPREFVGGDSVSEPRGVAADSRGNVYVADHGKSCVSVFSSAGKKLGQLPAKYAHLVAVHPGTGAVYVLCARSNPKKNAGRSWSSGSNFTDKELLKFKSLKSKSPAVSMVISKKSPARPKMALDCSGARPVIWVAGLRWGDGRIRKLADAGGKFEDVPTAMYSGGKKAVPGSYLDMTAAHCSDQVLVGASSRRSVALKRYDGLTGKFLGTVSLKTKMARGNMGQPQFSWDGRTVLYLPPLTDMFRFSLDGKLAPWSAPGSGKVSGLGQGFIRPRGHCGAPDGGAYVLHHAKHRNYTAGNVSRVGPDGKIAARDFIKIDAPVGGVKVDPQGNVYVGAFVLPKGKTLPDCFEGKLPGTLKKDQKWFYSNLYGTLFKFKGAGGALAGAADGEFTAGTGYRRHAVKAQGLLWSHYGLSPMPSRYTGCSCQTPRFDVDRYGRVFVPDTLRFSVKVLDGNGTQIGRIGRYGNLDDGLRAAKASGAGAPIYTAWPHAVAVTGRMLYIADMINHHIVAVKLSSCVEETVALR